MRIKPYLWAAKWCVAGVMALAFVACVDNDYDLDNVDLTVGLGDDIQLPSDNSTADIKLDDVLDLGVNNFLSVSEDGMYNIDAIDDNEFVAHMVVARFVVPSKSYKGSYTIDLGDFGPQGAPRKVKGADDVIEFEAPMVDLDFSFHHNTTQITRLTHIGFNTKLTVSLNFPKDLQLALKNIAQLTFSLPQCMECGKAAYLNDSISVDANNVLVLRDVNPADGVKFVLNVTGMDLSGKKADGSYMTYVQGDGIHFHGSLGFGVKVHESAVDFDKAAEAKDLTVTGSAVLDRFTVQSAKGGFTPVRSFGKVGGVSLKNVPSFLNDDEVNLDLYNPMLNINIFSAVPFPTKMTGAIVAKDSKGNVIKRIDVPQFSYKANGHSIVSIRRRPAEHASDTTIIVIPEICDVIRNVPDSIALIDLVGVGDDSEDAEITLSNYYEGRLRLSVASGIALEKDARIIYKHSYTGWNDKVKDINFVSTREDGTVDGYITVTADVENKIPAYLKLNAYGIDLSGNIIGDERLAVTVDKLIKASPDGVTPASTKVVINVQPKDKTVLKTLDGIGFRVTMTTNDGKNKVTGVMLNAYKQTIKATNIKIQKHGKVAIDLN